MINYAQASFTRPADTTPYQATDLVANSTTAGSVVPLPLVANVSNPFWLRGLTLRHSQASVANSNFRVWLMNASPTVTNGDNGAIAGPFLATVLNEPILIDVEALLTGGGAIGTSLFDAGMLRVLPSMYALIEARAAYTPASGEVFTLDAWGSAL